MKGLKKIAIWVLAILCLSSMSSYVKDSQIAFAQGGTTYYVDANDGSDEASGTSPQEAWKTFRHVNNVFFSPGDKILLKAGSTWEGQFRPRGSGAPGAPIVIDRYGEGPKPHIAGNGLSDSGAEGGIRQDGVDLAGNESGNATVLLSNQEYIEINNLQISNYKPGDQSIEFIRRGILVQGDGADDSYLDHIYIRNCDIHDISGNTYFGFTMHTSGGIIFQIVDGSKPTAYRDVRIENNNIYNVHKMGIDFKSSWRARGGYYTNEPGTGAWFPHENVVVRGNVLDNIGGDGIIVAETNGALVENNVLSRFNMMGGPAAGIWPLNTDNTTLRYNEVFEGHFARTDSQAFDVDWNNKRTVYEHNYSWNNAGGFMLLCAPGPGVLPENPASFNYGSIIRHNISQNDRGVLFTMSAVGRVSDYPNDGSDLDVDAGEQVLPLIYNNTFYVSDSLSSVKGVHNDGWGGGGAFGYGFYNNIVYVAEGAHVDFEQLITSSRPARFENNLFYGNVTFQGSVGGSQRIKNATYQQNNIFDVDPLFVAPGQAEKGRDSAAVYKLKENSPALGAGRVVKNNGGTDYFGNPVSSTERPNIGAYNGVGVPEGTTYTNNNLAVGKSVTVSSGLSQSAHVNDGKAYTTWTATEAGQQFVIIDLQEIESIGTIKLRMEPIPPANSSTHIITPMTFAIMGSNDGGVYTSIVDEIAYEANTGDNYGQIVLYPENQSARYIKIMYGGNVTPTLGELEIYNEGIDVMEQGGVSLVAPHDQSDNIQAKNTLSFQWENALDRSLSHLIVAEDIEFNTMVYVGQTTKSNLNLPKWTLESDKTYYWRVINYSNHKGSTSPIYRFKTKGAGLYTSNRENIALDKRVIASSSNTSWRPLVPAMAVDGSLSTANPSSWWNATGKTDEWLAVDLGRVALLTEVVVKIPSQWGGKQQHFRVDVSQDGTTYTTVKEATTYTFSGGADNQIVIPLAEVSGRHLRIYYPSTNTYDAQIGELEVRALANIAQDKEATSSSAKTDWQQLTADKAVDGSLSLSNPYSWWEAETKSNEWITVDLGAIHTVTGVGVQIAEQWGAKKQVFSIQISDDNINFTTVKEAAEYNSSNHGENIYAVTGLKATGRYIRIYYPENNSYDAQAGEIIINGYK